MLRLNAGVHAIFRDPLAELLIRKPVQLGAGNSLGFVGDDSQLLGNRHRCIPMIAGNHDRADSRAATFRNRGLDLRADGVDHAGQPQKHQIPLQIFRRVVFGLFRPVPLCDGEDAQRPVRHGLVAVQDFPPLRFRHGQDFSAFKIVRAAGKQRVRRALCVLNKALAALVNGGHHLSGGVKGRFVNARGLFLEVPLFRADGAGEIHQRALGRLALSLILIVQHRVGAQRHRRRDGKRLADVLHDGHFVLRQRARFVGADHLRAAERLDSGQAANDGVFPGHFRHADGKHHRNHRRQSLRNGRNRQRNSHHEGLQHDLQRVTACGQFAPRHKEIKGKDEHADAQHHLGQQSAQLVQLPLQGRLLVLCS